jgi:hypothetical protein
MKDKEYIDMKLNENQCKIKWLRKFKEMIWNLRKDGYNDRLNAHPKK